MSGLRERKKQQTRRSLSLAALGLCRERGWAAVTADDVAAAAGVSVRTFGNYFPGGKAEAIAALHLDRMHEVADELAARPPDEPLSEALTRAVLPRFAIGDDGDENPPDPAALDATRFILTEPALQAEILRASALAEDRLARAVATRTGADPVRDLAPGLTATVVAAAIGFTLTRWLRADPPVALGPLLREALARAVGGVDGPHPGRPA